MQFRFADPIWLWLLVLLIPLLTLMIIKVKKLPQTMAWMRFVCLPGAFLLLIFAMARPQTGNWIGIQRGLIGNLFVMADISESMLATDTLPSRLKVMIQFCERLFGTLNPGVRVALFPFTGDGYLLMSLTTDRAAALDMLDTLNPYVASQKGTGLNSAFQSLWKQIHRIKRDNQEEIPTQVLLLTDGESHEPIDTSFLKKFRQIDIPVHVVGIGTTQGATIVPSVSRSQIQTKLNPTLLKEIANITGGNLSDASLQAVPPLAERIQRLLSQGAVSTKFEVNRECFIYFLATGLLLLFLNFILGRWEWVIRATAAIAMIVMTVSGNSWAEEKNAYDLYNEGTKMIGDHTDQAIPLLEEALSLVKDNPELKKKILNNLGNSYLRELQVEQALQSFQQAFDTKVETKNSKKWNNEISDNMVLASRIREKLKKMAAQMQADQQKSQGKDPGKDRDGPQKDYQPQHFSDADKKKIYELLKNEEQQALQRIANDRKQGKGNTATDKPW